uniref:Tudor domain-containing protein n=1 Tax=Syphacia muris TaxID=451379 RepID=A0A0N5AQR1_9BILA
MIVFDSAKARERRNRGAVMEKIKSDFSKFMNRTSHIFFAFNKTHLKMPWKSLDLNLNIVYGQQKKPLMMHWKSCAASYELFAQILPAQPGAVLCRVNIPCDLIVSLRSLSNRAETVIISIDVDGAYWSANEKHKFLYVKESGLGQTSFVIVPNITGFLPYPPVTVHRCQHKRSNSVFPFFETFYFFVRSGGKQVHVLGLQHSSTGDQKYGSERAKRLKEAKNRLAKLFD